MELRSTTRKERDGMQRILTDFGYYEEGMEMAEMRQLIHILLESYPQKDVERGELIELKETEIEFSPMDEAYNSTMLGTRIGHVIVTPKTKLKSVKKRTSNSKPKAMKKGASSPFSSPEVSSQQFTVVAEIHHSYDWSPPQTPPSTPLKSPCLNIPQKSYPLGGTHKLKCRAIAGAKKPRIETEIAEIGIDSFVNMKQHAAVIDFSDIYDTDSTSFSHNSNDLVDGDSEWLP